MVHLTKGCQDGQSCLSTMIFFVKGGCIQAFLGYVGKVAGILERDWTLELEDPISNPRRASPELSDVEPFSNSTTRLAHLSAGLLGEARKLRHGPASGLGLMDISQCHNQGWFPLQELQFFKRTGAL